MSGLHKVRGQLWVGAVAGLLVCACALGYWGLRALRAPTPRVLRLPDGTEVFYLSDTKIRPVATYPQQREIRIDGDAFIRATAAAQPLLVRSRLLLLTVMGESGLRVTARSQDTGEEADVLYGRVAATKAYPSQQHDTDILHGGEEVMVNETIDLQEKETTDVAGLRAWSQALMASTVPTSSRRD